MLETDKYEPRSDTKRKLAIGLGVEPQDLDEPRARQSWKQAFSSDPRYSDEQKRVILEMAELWEKQQRRRR